MLTACEADPVAVLARFSRAEEETLSSASDARPWSHATQRLREFWKGAVLALLQRLQLILLRHGMHCTLPALSKLVGQNSFYVSAQAESMAKRPHGAEWCDGLRSLRDG